MNPPSVASLPSLRPPESGAGAERARGRYWPLVDPPLALSAPPGSPSLPPAVWRPGGWAAEGGGRAAAGRGRAPGGQARDAAGVWNSPCPGTSEALPGPRRTMNKDGITCVGRNPVMSWWTAQMQQSSGPVCRMCLQEPGDPEKLGEFLQRDNLRIHYFCLILSSGLPQRGRASDGFHGFLPEDIKKETSRAARKTCFVCKKKGAAIFCQKERCRRNFHLPCGRERGCISQFFGEYNL
uniref:PHD-type domain-containing protein n=1 Tax=Vombatus ursinus TaxID=29139 RepID=A0A4X2LIW6_VOMUR